ncbi:leucyl aminopeptidase family protein [Thiothrix nivea]|uniref:Peptidase M17 leucyl aminopeptidase domain protein n=1 Tax=Thiothrix nivea (strain ATCC 35100 / DSM 5205 / JP2) TaxID=870187 RepID=A0A656HE35_THINJ|nr:leucyl aminopeptidase family protein [Thiothrix nivea]EIJ33459.1 peptidase M17 leucyl aminopeptidase domain protein [Thiothrix nivea DSM 5205]
MFTQEKPANSIALHPLTQAGWGGFAASLPEASQHWAKLHAFSAKPGQVCLLPDVQGGISKVLAGYDEADSLRWAIAGLPGKLPGGHYHLECDWPESDRLLASLGWGLGYYRFENFTKPDNKPRPVLYMPEQQDRARAFIQAVALVRDLINQPANHMMPEHLSAATGQLAKAFGADFSEVVGEDLLRENYPAIHAVGRASSHAPRLLKLRWGNPDHPAVTLVGKGICFDTGGLDIKPSQYMRLMKKDMGGAAHVLGLARLIMQLQLPVHLRVLIPAADNAIGGDAFRPGDILATRAGKQVEVDNTDAEGRLVLCDALTDAVAQKPQLLLDFATLTGAARVALGTEIPVFFSNNRELTAKLQAASAASGELIWNLPLHQPYFEQLKSNHADFTNSGGSYGGAITAALFLNEFIPKEVDWAHFDIMAWNSRERAGRPVGGEAMGLFAVYAYLESVYPAA